MKSSIRSKLFLIVYGIILAFIAGLILLNNSFLENYYISNRKASLIEAFNAIKEVNMESEDLQYSYDEIENYYNIDIQVLVQTGTFDEDYVWSFFDPVPNVYARVYGNRFNIPEGILSKVIYDFNKEEFLSDDSYATRVDMISDDEYDAYLMDIQSEFNLNTENQHMIGLCVSRTIDADNQYFYVLTVTFQSIQDSIKIFNSFTIIVGFIFMILAFIVMYFISYSFTNPILQINKIAQEIANLNFENKLNIKTDDEYQDLGSSINLMSTQLEKNIDELKKSNKRLAEEIMHKTDVDKMRREFIASASHELKTPLSLIMGYAEALKLEGIDNFTKDEYLSIILDETDKMNKLVQELLKLSQLESGNTQFEYEDVNLKDFIYETKKLFNLVFEDKGITCDVESEDIVINTDQTQLQKVLSNFISNAINHLDDFKYIKLAVNTKIPNKIRVSVFNAGENIPENEIKNIWDSFYKVDKARTRAYGGQGLGLSICKTTLDILGYDYGVINHENGVEFYFDILKR